MSKNCTFIQLPTFLFPSKSSYNTITIIIAQKLSREHSEMSKNVITVAKSLIVILNSIHSSVARVKITMHYSGQSNA